MFENITQFFKRFKKSEKEESRSTAKERLHLVLAQDRANISADFLEMMKQEILEVIKKYIDIDEKAIDVRLTNKEGEDGSIGAPALYANIPIITIKNEARKLDGISKEKISENKIEEHKDDKKEDIENKDDNNEETINLEDEKEKNEDDTENNSKDEENSKKELENQQEKLNNHKLDEVDNEKKNS